MTESRTAPTELSQGSAGRPTSPTGEAGATNLPTTDEGLVERARYRVDNPSAWDAYDEGASEIIRELVTALTPKPTADEVDPVAEWRARSTTGATTRQLAYVAPTSDDKDEGLREALQEAKLQLEYLDARFPTGTTPAVIARIDAALSTPTADEGLREALLEEVQLAYGQGYKEGAEDALQDRDHPDCAAEGWIDYLSNRPSLATLSTPTDGGWRPIEEAPKDGSYFLIWRPDRWGHETTHVVQWDDGWWQVHDGKHWHPLRGKEPTLWKPLGGEPTPPKGGE